MNRARLACIKHIACAAIALGFILCAIEVGLRIYVATQPGQIAADDPGDSLVVRSWQTHHGLKPLSSIACRNPDSGKAVVVATNSFAIRGPEPAVPKPAGTFRVLCLGDETTLAPDVALEQTFCRQIELLLQPHCRLKLEVVNAGVPGYCPLLSYLQARHSLLALQPDLILLNFDMGDVWDDYRYRRHTHIGAAGAPLCCPHPAFIMPASSRQPGIADQFLLVRWGRSQLGALPIVEERPEDLRRIDSSQSKYAWLTDSPPDWSIHIEQALAPVAQLQQLAGRDAPRVALAVYPAPWQISKAASSGPGVRSAAGVGQAAHFRSRLPFDTLNEYARKQSIAFHDASPAFQSIERPERLYLAGAPRFSAIGHKLYAQELARFIFETISDIWKSERPSSEPAEPLRSAHRGN